MSYYSLISLMPKSTGIDPDAQAFITAAAITNPTQQSAINQLVVDLKGYSIWTKFKAIYPIVGGVASSHAVNLKTPGTFNLTFASGWTHSANGMTPTNAYADTNFSVNQMTASNAAFGIYSRTNDTTGLKVIGAYDGINVSRCWINLSNGNIQIADTGQIPYTANPSTGLFMSRRDATNFNQSYRNGVSLGSVTNNFTAFNRNFYLGAANDDGVPNYFSTHQLAFAFLGGNSALTNTDAANFYTAVQAYQTTLGRSIGTQTVSDADAQAFVNAANITDQVEANAINNLVIGLKAYGIWTKMKAIYPIVGGSASSHAVNLKTPGTYNLTFASGWTHSATGMLPNGASAYADTNLQVNLITQNNGHLSYYSRSNTAGGAGTFKVEVGYLKITPSFAASSLAISRDGASFGIINSTGSATTTTNADTRGFYVANRLSSSVQTLDKNGSVVNTSNDTSVEPPSTVMSYWIGARNSPDNTGAINYSDRECSFSSLGDGLTPTERANFRTAVQAFQTTLGRQVGVPIVSDSDAQAFLNAAVIEDVTQANAVNNLVIGMKADGIWTKMKAIYPIVGGVASSHAVNLKTPGTFNLTFASGWTHSANGMTPTNAYANTNFNDNLLTLNSAHICIYSRTNINGLYSDIGAIGASNKETNLFPRYTDLTYSRIQALTNNTIANTDSRGLFIANRTSSTIVQSIKNTTINNISSTSIGNTNFNIYLGALNSSGTATFNSVRELAFASIGDGLTNTDATNLYNRVQTYQTTLSRQV